MNPFHAFTLARVPVHISPFFLLLVFMIGARAGGAMEIALVIAALSISILVHEFGHAFVAKWFGLGPSITLHGLGGLCAHRPAPTALKEALITAAGPGAGLLLAAGSLVGWLIFTPTADAQLVELTAAPPHVMLFQYIALFSILINLFNLIPVFPLDGGQLLRIGSHQLLPPTVAHKVTHGAGLVLALGLILLGTQTGLWFMAIIAGFLAWMNFQALQASPISATAARPQSRFSKKVLTDAALAYQAQDYQEAARLCHQLRKDSNVTPDVLRQVWPLLGLATAHNGEPREALSYLAKAELHPEIADARVECLLRLGEEDEARRVVASEEFASLRPNILQRLRLRVGLA